MKGRYWSRADKNHQPKAAAGADGFYASAAARPAWYRGDHRHGARAAARRAEIASITDAWLVVPTPGGALSSLLSGRRE